MPNMIVAERLANRLAEMIGRLTAEAHDLSDDGWHVSGQQLRNAVNLLLDVERRLRNGDDWNG